MQPRIVYTRFDGGVNVCCPAIEMLCWLSFGGFFAGWTRSAVQRQIDSQIANGGREQTVRRYISALLTGGCTTAEALDIIRERDCEPHGTGFELWQDSDLPDRWFRNAWRRSANGGPIMIDLEKARIIQALHIQRAVFRANKRPQGFVARFMKTKPLIEPNWDRLEQDIRAADDENELRAVWPDELLKEYIHG